LRKKLISDSYDNDNEIAATGLPRNVPDVVAKQQLDEKLAAA